jgi:hypothetical protein
MLRQQRASRGGWHRARLMLPLPRMETVLAYWPRLQTLPRWAWLAFVLVLAACKQGDSSGGGGY